VTEPAADTKPLRTWRPMAAGTAGILVALGLALVTLTVWHRSGGQHEPVLGYEPDVEKISGIVSIGHARHPNGTKMTYPVLTMTQPVTVSRNSDGFNQPEQHITEIQLVSDNQLTSENGRGQVLNCVVALDGARGWSYVAKTVGVRS
jgi:hypothetical protein